MEKPKAVSCDALDSHRSKVEYFIKRTEKDFEHLNKKVDNSVDGINRKVDESVDRINKKLDKLIEFRTLLIGASIGVSGLVSVVLNFLLKHVLS